MATERPTEKRAVARTAAARVSMDTLKYPLVAK